MDNANDRINPTNAHDDTLKELYNYLDSIKNKEDDPEFNTDKICDEVNSAKDNLRTYPSTSVKNVQTVLEWTLQYIFDNYVKRLERKRDLNLAELLNNEELSNLFKGHKWDSDFALSTLNLLKYKVLNFMANAAKHDMSKTINDTEARIAYNEMVSLMLYLCSFILNPGISKLSKSASPAPVVKTSMTLTIERGVWKDYNTKQSTPCLKAKFKKAKFKYVPEFIRPESCTWTNSEDANSEPGIRHLLSYKDIGRTYYCDVSQDAIILHAEYNVTEEDLTFQNSRLQTSSSKMPAEKPAQTPAEQSAARQERITEKEAMAKARAKAKTEPEAQFVQISAGEANTEPLEPKAKKSDEGFGTDNGTKEEQIAKCTTTIRQNDRQSTITPDNNTLDYEYINTSDGIVLTKYNGQDADVIIPSNHCGMPIVGIRESTFFRCDRIKTITVPSSISSIEPGAFFGYPRRSSIEAIRVLEENERYQSNIEGCLLSKDGKTYLFHAPQSTVSRTACVVPDFVTTLGGYAFAGSIDLKSVVLPGQLKLVEDSAFTFSGIQSIFIPNSVNFIGRLAFADCRALQEIQLPKHLVIIREAIFAFCYSLEKIAIPDSVKSIERRAFWQCKRLAGIELPNGLVTIGEEAFGACEHLLVIVPDSVKEIGKAAFSDHATVCCSPNSFAWEYCEKNGIRRWAIEN